MKSGRNQRQERYEGKRRNSYENMILGGKVNDLRRTMVRNSTPGLTYGGEIYHCFFLFFFNFVYSVFEHDDESTAWYSAVHGSTRRERL